MDLRSAIEAVVRRPSDIKARGALAAALQARGVPEATAVWKATASAAGGRGQFFVALALGRRFLPEDQLEVLLYELARRYGAGRPRQGPVAQPPDLPPLEVELPADEEELAWLGVRIGCDVEGLMLPRFARMPAIPIFEELPEDQFVTLAREAEAVMLADGTELLAQDEVERAVYVLCKGHAKAVARKPDGAELDLGVRAGPTVLGEMALLTQAPSRASITALGPGLAWRIDAERLVQLGASQPGLVKRLRTLVKERLLQNLLRASQVLSRVDRQEALLHAFAVRTFAPAAEVFPQGAPAPGLFFILYGTAEVWVRGEDGQARRVAVLTEGDAFGEMSLLTGEPTTAAVRMPDGGIVLHLPVEDYRELRGDVGGLENGLAELMDVRRGELSQVYQAPADEEVEEIDESWVVELEE